MFGSRLVVRKFESSVQKFEERDVEEVRGRILFYGHSLFTRCTPNNAWGNPSMEDHVLGQNGERVVLNHGFGSSSADDLLYYYPRLVRPYAPRALVLCASNNDFGFGYSAYEVVDILARIVDWAKADFPEIKIVCFSNCPVYKHVGKPSVFTRQRADYDRFLELMCKEKDVGFVKLIDRPFFFENPEDAGDYDKLRHDLYSPDDTHFGPEGYLAFFGLVKEILADLL